MVNIASIKNLVGLTRADEAELALHHGLVQAHDEALHELLKQWLQVYLPEQTVSSFFTKAFIRLLRYELSGEEVFSVVYQQALRWQKLDLQETALFVLMSRIRQFYVELAQRENQPALARALCHLVGAIQAVISSVYHLARTLERFRERAEFEVKRVENMFLMIDQSPPKMLIQVYRDHQRWKQLAYEIILGISVKASLERSPQKCALGRWLEEEGGWRLIPKTRQEDFKKAHERVHLLGSKLLETAQERALDELLVLIRDIEEASDEVATVLLQAMDQIFVEVATLDALTGLPNRRSFERDYRQAVKVGRRYHLYLGLHLLDLDHFKQVNDTYGHLKGDEVLKTFSDAIASLLREEDKLYRWGGEEFAIVTLHRDAQGAETFSGRLFDRFNQLQLANQLALQTPLTMSMATVSVDPAFEEPPMEQRVFAAADTLLYRAKTAGRNQAWAGHMDEKGRLREESVHRIRP